MYAYLINFISLNVDTTYHQVKKMLKEGRCVLYSGTLSDCWLIWLSWKNDPNLLTVDLICHGVPSQQMFLDYLNTFATINKFNFRDKALGWSKNGSVTISIQGKTEKKKLWESEQPYLYYFGNGLIQRDSCYQCKYTCQHRPVDITVGDYWGIEKQHLDYLGKNGLDTKKGGSMVIANTEKGAEAIRGCTQYIDLKESTFEKVATGNVQLTKPTVKKPQRQEILAVYAKHGWEVAAERFRKRIGVKNIRVKSNT